MPSGMFNSLEPVLYILGFLIITGSIAIIASLCYLLNRLLASKENQGQNNEGEKDTHTNNANEDDADTKDNGDNQRDTLNNSPHCALGIKKDAQNCEHYEHCQKPAETTAETQIEK